MVKREPEIDGLNIDEYIIQSADPIWLHQNMLWEYIKSEHAIASENDDLEDQENFF